MSRQLSVFKLRQFLDKGLFLKEGLLRTHVCSLLCVLTITYSYTSEFCVCGVQQQHNETHSCWSALISYSYYIIMCFCSTSLVHVCPCVCCWKLLQVSHYYVTAMYIIMLAFIECIVLSYFQAVFLHAHAIC